MTEARSRLHAFSGMFWVGVCRGEMTEFIRFVGPYDVSDAV